MAVISKSLFAIELVPFQPILAKVPVELLIAVQYGVIPQSLQASSSMRRSSMPASTMEPLPRSLAMKRRRTSLVRATKSVTAKECWIQPPFTSPVGPTVSTLVQLAPPLFEMSTTNTSAFGEAPVPLLYQR